MTGILNYPRKVLSDTTRIINAVKALRGKADGFVGTNGAGIAQVAQLGTGTTDSTTFLRGDSSWQTVTSGALPVGSVFIAVVSTDPSTLLGYGTWSSIGAGRVLVGLNSADTDFDVVEETGGAKTSTPSAHTGTAVAAHAVATTSAPDDVVSRGNTGAAVSVGTDVHVHTVTLDAHAVTQPATHSAMSVVQPYLVVYMWKRTA